MTRAEHWKEFKWAISLALLFVGVVWLIVTPLVWFPVGIFVWHLGFWLSLFATSMVMLVALLAIFLAILIRGWGTIKKMWNNA